MKYESELIKEIVDTRGHETPLLHYESECIESWIDEAKGAYPKLADYRGEWLNYIVENPLGEFPYITLSDVTDATVDNVVPYAYKSAILTGNTLVNDIDLTNRILTSGNTITSDGYITINANSEFSNAFVGYKKIKSNTKYLCIVDIKEFTANGDFNLTGTNSQSIFNFHTSIPSKTLGIEKFIFTTRESIDESVNIYSFRSYLNSLSTEGYIKYRLMMIEYQDGMENWDIPYFEGMQSVKMPVLTTTGKNLFDGRLEDGYIGSDGTNVGWTNYKRSVNLIKINPKLKYTISKNSSHIGGTFGIFQYDCNNQFISTYYISSTANVQTFTFDERANYIRIACVNNAQFPIEFVQVEEGSTATSYEPFKTNILTVNEDVTLRSNGDVYDELNLLTGRLTQRIDENNEVLAQEVVKTVDLSITDQDGNTLSKIKPIEGTMHLATSSDTLKPTFSGEIPVEATTQNLASFIVE